MLVSGLLLGDSFLGQGDRGLYGCPMANNCENARPVGIWALLFARMCVPVLSFLAWKAWLYWPILLPASLLGFKFSAWIWQDISTFAIIQMS